MSPCDHHVSRHRYPRPRGSRISTATDPLSVAADREPRLCLTTAEADPSLHPTGAPKAVGNARLPTYGAERKREDFVDSVQRANILCSTHADIECCRCGHFSYREIRIGSDDSSARACASQVPNTFPRRLRPPSLATRSTASLVQREVPSPTYLPARRPRISIHPDVICRPESQLPPHDSLVLDGLAAETELRRTTTRTSSGRPVAMPRLRPSCEDSRCSRPETECTRAMSPRTAHVSQHGFAPLPSEHSGILFASLADGKRQHPAAPDVAPSPTTPSRVEAGRMDAPCEHLTRSLPDTTNPRPKSTDVRPILSRKYIGPSATPAQ